MKFRRSIVILLSLCSPLLTAAPGDYFRITVVDEATSRGVPLIKMTAAGGVAHLTDSAGVIAFHEPALMNRDVHFMVEGHGYKFRPDGFGMRGLTLRADAGSSAMVVIQRENIAERLYRVTGSGIYSDSMLLGDKPPIKEPLMNSGVVGQDSVMTANYRGRIFWLWGDTTPAGHPLKANYMTTCAWSDFPGKGGLDPDKGVDLEYIADGDFTKRMVDVPTRGVYWLHSLLTVPDETGNERMLAGYTKIKPPLSSEERGWMEYDGDRDVFVPFRKDDMDSLILGDGHVFRVREGETDYFYFPSSTQFTRLPATYQDIKAGNYEAWTCLKDGRASDADAADLDRDEEGRLRYSWRKSAEPVGFGQQETLTSGGLIAENEQWISMRDIATGKTVRPHANTIRWNPHRNRWVMIVCEIMGTSMLGEIWYAEADSPTGPWAYATKIVTHDTYSFYNPYLHTNFDKENGRILYFEGTYTMGFSGTTIPTPRYDYNQIMYKLDLDDPRLTLPVPIYEHATTNGSVKYRNRQPEDISSVLPGNIAFYAHDRPTTYTVPITGAEGRLVIAGNSNSDVHAEFHGIALEISTPLPNTQLLFEWENGQNYKYAPETVQLSSSWTRAKRPLCRVWIAPTSNAVLASD